MVHILHLNLNKYHSPLENCLSAIINRAHGEWKDCLELQSKASDGRGGSASGGFTVVKLKQARPLKRSGRPISSHLGRHRGIGAATRGLELRLGELNCI